MADTDQLIVLSVESPIAAQEARTAAARLGAGGAALSAKLRDTGVSDDFIKSVKEEIEAGRADRVLLVSHVNQGAVGEELKRFKGLAKLVSGNLSDESVQRVKEALEQDS